MTGVHGLPPLTGRREPWMDDLLADPGAVQSLIAEFGSPVNVIEPSALARNAAELVAAGEAAGVPTRVFYARKANKTHAMVRQAIASGHGVDVASLAELSQVLELGMPPERVIVSAAIKSDALLELAVTSGVTISVDHVAELHRIAVRARERPAAVAPRLAPDPSSGVPPTRFGELADVWIAALGEPIAGIDVTGLHVHLHGYAADDRARAIASAARLAGRLRELGHEPTFLDLGGGVPMSYLDDAGEWDAFWAALSANEEPEAITWRDHRLATVYPYHQAPVRGEWLAGLLQLRPEGGPTCAELLRGAGLALHMEPGRSLADGCGLTLARVAFVKTRSDGLPLVGVEMNRTQCRSTSDDFMVDPVLVRTQPEGEPSDGFLVGAYCIEDEIILRRRMHFPRGVAPGDIIALINTGGYLMHILESASHQLPLAKNVVWPSRHLDGIDHA